MLLSEKWYCTLEEWAVCVRFSEKEGAGRADAEDIQKHRRMWCSDVPSGNKNEKAL